MRARGERDRFAPLLCAEAPLDLGAPGSPSHSPPARTGPPGDPGEPPRIQERAQLRELLWKPTEQPRAFEAKGDVELANIVQSASAGGQVTSYTLSFWALYGEERTMAIDFSDDYGMIAAFYNIGHFTFNNARHAIQQRRSRDPLVKGDAVQGPGPDFRFFEEQRRDFLLGLAEHIDGKVAHILYPFE